MANTLILCPRENGFFLIPVVKTIRSSPVEKMALFDAYANFLSFHSLVLKEKSLFAVKIYSFLERKKKKAFCFHSTKLGNIKGKAATYFAFQRIWRNVI